VHIPVGAHRRLARRRVCRWDLTDNFSDGVVSHRGSRDTWDGDKATKMKGYFNVSLVSLSRGVTSTRFCDLGPDFVILSWIFLK